MCVICAPAPHANRQLMPPPTHTHTHSCNTHSFLPLPCRFKHLKSMYLPCGMLFKDNVRPVNKHTELELIVPYMPDLEVLGLRYLEIGEKHGKSVRHRVV